jgi:hypothetical protein
MPEFFILEPHSFGLSEEQLRLIGLIAISWNNLEVDLEERIWQLDKWSAPIGTFVTNHMTTVPRIELFKNLVRYQITNESLRTDAETWCRFFDRLRGRRNDFVHAIPRFGPDGFDSYIKRQTKGGGGTIKITAHNLSVAELENLSWDLRLCETGSYLLFEKMMRFFNGVSSDFKESDPLYELSQEVRARIQTQLSREGGSGTKT